MFLTGMVCSFYPSPVSLNPAFGGRWEEAKSSSNESLTWKTVTGINRPAPFPVGKGGGIGRTPPLFLLPFGFTPQIVFSTSQQFFPDTLIHAPINGQLSIPTSSIPCSQIYLGLCSLVISLPKTPDCFWAYSNVLTLGIHARNNHLQTKQYSDLERQNQACPTQPDFFSILKYGAFAKFESSPVPYFCFLSP